MQEVMTSIFSVIRSGFRRPRRFSTSPGHYTAIIEATAPQERGLMRVCAEKVTTEEANFKPCVVASLLSTNSILFVIARG
jgi:hypothetical protein